MYGAEGREVGPVVVAADDDEGVPAAELRLDRRQLDRLERQLRLALDVLEGVHREPLELAADRGTRRVHGGLDLVGGDRVAGGDQLVAAPDLGAVDANLLALVQAVEHVLTGTVDKRDAGLDHSDRPAVRVPARDRFAGVHDRAHARSDEAFGGDPVEIAVVDHGDVARLQALHEVLGPPVDANRSGHGRRRTRATPGHAPSPA